MVHRAVLALPYHGRSGQNDREHRHVVDDPHDAREPRRGEVRVVGDPNGERDRRHRDSLTPRQKRAFSARYEPIDLGRQDRLEVARAESGLHHCRRVDIDLYRGMAAAEDVALEAWRDSITNVYWPTSRRRSMSRAAIGCGALKYGGNSADAICRESAELSSSTMPTEALCSSWELLCAWVYTAKENAQMTSAQHGIVQEAAEAPGAEPKDR